MRTEIATSAIVNEAAHRSRGTRFAASLRRIGTAALGRAGFTGLLLALICGVSVAPSLAAIGTPTSIAVGSLDTTAGTSLVITTTAGAAVGNTVVVTFGMDPANGTVSCTHSGGNTYTSDADVANGAGTATGARSLVFSTRVSTALVAGDTITITHPSVASRAAGAFTVSGITPATRVDKSATATG